MVGAIDCEVMVCTWPGEFFVHGFPWPVVAVVILLAAWSGFRLFHDRVHAGDAYWAYRVGRVR